MALLRTETLVDALTVLMPFWEQHDSLEDRDTQERPSGFRVVLGTAFAFPGG